jgi:AcrR family transcriptional regulator
MTADDNSEARSRDRERTEQTFIDATIDLIRDEGFGSVGINAIADRAGASKVLIYRYFGGLEGLFRAVAETLDPIHSRGAYRELDEIGGRLPLSEIFRRVILQSHESLKEDDIAKQLMVWELSHQNALTQVFSEAREAAGLKLTDDLWQAASGESKLPGLDIHALLAILTAGVYYMTLRSDAVSDYNGVNLQTEEGWQRIADAVGGLVSLAERGAAKAD